MNPPPQPPKESQLTPEQRKALARIMKLASENFHRAMISLVYKGEDQKLHMQVVSTAVNKEENLSLATMTLQEVQKAETGLITTLSPEQKRIVQ